jgi:plasmid stabilization system protein ParE
MSPTNDLPDDPYVGANSAEYIDGNARPFPQPEQIGEPLSAIEEARWRAYIEAACREVAVVKGGLFDMSARLFATLDAARLAAIPATPDVGLPSHGFAANRPDGPRTQDGHALASRMRRTDPAVDWDAWVRSIEDQAAALAATPEQGPGLREQITVLRTSNDQELAIARRAADAAGRSAEWDGGHHDGWDDALEAVLAALAATPEQGPGLDDDGGVMTWCPLTGVHEHAFRGPHKFKEWDPTPISVEERWPARLSTSETDQETP